MKIRLRYTLTATVFLFTSCTTITTTPVYPYGEGRYTVSATAYKPQPARERAISDASDFCALQSQRSLPLEINLITLVPEVHSVTVVFLCFAPEDMLKSVMKQDYKG